MDKRIEWIKAALRTATLTPVPSNCHLSTTREQSERARREAIGDLERDLYAAENGPPVPGFGGEIFDDGTV